MRGAFVGLSGAVAGLRLPWAGHVQLNLAVTSLLNNPCTATRSPRLDPRHVYNRDRVAYTLRLMDVR